MAVRVALLFVTTFEKQTVPLMISVDILQRVVIDLDQMVNTYILFAQFYLQRRVMIIWVQYNLCNPM